MPNSQLIMLLNRFLEIWEEIYNPNFNSPEFEGIKNETAKKAFIKIFLTNPYGGGTIL